MEVIKKKLQETFERCQERQHNLSKIAESLKKFFTELCSETQKKNIFIEEFLFYVECLLQESSRDLAIERCIQFLAIFSAYFADTCDDEEEIVTSDEENLYNQVISLLLLPEIHCHSNKTIRFRVCQLIQLLLGAVPQNAALDEELMDRITAVMLHRIQDKIPTVRAQAAKSLSRLQQPQVKDCPVIEAYLFHMACDDSTPVRAAALSNISLTTKTLPAVIDRTRDVAENVRKIAYQVLAQKVSMKALTSSQRLYLVKQGLLDRSEAVQDVVKKQLFQAWLLACDANLLDLLKKLDVIGAYDTCCKAVLAMFECSRSSDLLQGFTLLNQDKLIEISTVTPESVLYWHQLCAFMRKKGSDGDEFLESLLPSSLLFAEYMENFINKVLVPFLSKSEGKLSPEEEDDKIEKEFVAEQLIKIAVEMDVSDNAGCKALKEVLRKAIIQLDITCFPCLVAPLSSALLQLQNSNQPLESEENEKALLIVSLISTVREPRSAATHSSDVTPTEKEILRIKQELAKVAVLLNEANEELAQCVASKDFVEAGKIQQKIDEINQTKEELSQKLKPAPQDMDVTLQSSPEKSDVGTLAKCLILVKQVLISIFECRCVPSRIKQAPPRGIHPSLLQLLETLVIPSVLNDSPAVRREAIPCLGIGCMFSAALATRHFALLMQVAQADIYAVRVAAINAVNNLIRLFGIKVLTSHNDNNTSLNKSNEVEDVETSSKQSVEDTEEIDMTQIIIDKFVEMLDDKEVEVRLAATSLLACVLVSHRVLSPAVVTRLILLWYDPGTRDEPAILHTISNFLDVFPYMSRQSHECVQSSFLPVLRVLFNAPPSSPFASVNVNNVAELIVSITRPCIVLKTDLKSINIKQDTRWLKDWSAHDDFAVMIANEVLSDPTSPFVNSLCRILILLDLNLSQADNIQDLEVLTVNMMKEVKDKEAIRHIRKFQTHITSLLKLIKKNDVPTSNEALAEEAELGSLRIISALQEVDMNPSSPMSPSAKITKTCLEKEKSSLGNPKRNLSTAFKNVAT